MPESYVTFGQIHAHHVNNVTFDKDSIAVIQCDNSEHGRQLAFELFGKKFCFVYHEGEFDQDCMRYFPRGYIKAN
jgi:hypothetical protein